MSSYDMNEDYKDSSSAPKRQIYPSHGVGSGSIGSSSGAQKGSIGSNQKLTSNGNGPSVSNGAGITAIMMTQPKWPLMMFGDPTTGDITLTFYQEEGADWVKATLEPAYDMTPRESLQVSNMISMIQTLAMAGAATHAVFRPIAYIRNNNLERHFLFKIA